MEKLNNISNALAETASGSEPRRDAPAQPEPSNGGGTSAALEISEASPLSDNPPLVTRGESKYQEHMDEAGEKYLFVIKNGRPNLIHLPQPKIDGVPSSAIVDFLNCSFHFPETEGLGDFFDELIPILGNKFTPVVDRNAKKHCYDYSFDLGESKAIFAYGGNNNTALLSLSGHSCHMIPDWKRLVNFLAKIRKAKITRIDCAHDDYEGLHSVDMALDMYRDGLFNTGGREPLMDQRGNWFRPDGRGRTLYIGSSENGKLLRVYEKGKQLGAKEHPWVRWELQYGSRDRVIPWDAVLEPGNYLAGGFPKATGWVSEEQSRIRTVHNTASICYDSLTHYASVAYGRHLNVMLQVEGSAKKVIAKLIRDGVPARLNLPAVAGD